MARSNPLRGASQSNQIGIAMSNKPNKWKVRVDDAWIEIIIEVNKPQPVARSSCDRTFTVSPSYALRLILRQIAFLDLWNRAHGRQNSWPWNVPTLVLQVLSPKQTEDPLAFVEFYQGDTVVSFDTMAQMADDPECDETTLLSNKVFGFFGLPNYPTG